MGKNKALLKFKESLFIEIAMNAFENFEEIIIIANDKDPYLKYNIKVYSDIIKDIGPIGGIYTALNYSKYDIVVVACDMPYINSEVLNAIGSKMNKESIISITDKQIQPLCSGYKKNILNIVKNCIDVGEYKLLNFIDKIDKEFLYFDNKKKCFNNINTVEDYNQLNL